MNAMPPGIRPALPEDAPAMSRVFAAAIEAKARDSYGPRERAAWAARGTPERFAAMLDDPRNRLFVAVSEAAIHGIAGLTGCELSLLYTTPAAPPVNRLRSGRGARPKMPRTTLAAMKAANRAKIQSGLRSPWRAGLLATGAGNASSPSTSLTSTAVASTTPPA